MKKDKNRRIFVVSSVFLCIFIYYLFFSDNFIRNIEEFPYFPNEHVNNALMKYFTLSPVKSVTILTGSYKCGKSSTLRNISDVLRAKSRLVIDFDIKGIQTPEQFFQGFKLSVWSSLVKLQPYLKNDLRKLGTKSQNSGLEGILSDIYGSISKILDQSYENDHVSLIGVSSMMDIFEKMKDSLKPIIIFYNSDAIFDNAFVEVLNAFKSQLIRRNQYFHSLPIVLEVKDSYIVHTLVNDGYQAGLFDEIRVQELNNTNIDYLVNNFYFKPREMRYIKQMFGHHPGFISAIYHDLVLGLSIEQAISRQINILQNNLPIKNQPNLKKQLCKKHKIYIPSYLIADEHVQLLRSGVCHIDGNMSIVLSSGSFKRVIC